MRANLASLIEPEAEADSTKIPAGIYLGKEGYIPITRQACEHVMGNHVIH
jgi:hypothetical protein